MNARVPPRRLLLLVLLQAFDLFILAVASLPLLSEVSDGVANHPGGHGLVRLLLATATAPIVWRFSQMAAGAYKSHRLSSLRQQFANAACGTTLGTAGIVGLLGAVGLWSWSFGAVFLAWFIATSLSISGRLVMRLLLNATRRCGRNLRHVLVLGSNERAQAFAKAVQDQPELGMRIIGFVDDEWRGLTNFEAMGIRRVGDLGATEDLLRQSIVDEVIVCLPIKSYYEVVADVAKRCQILGILMRVEGELFSGKLAFATATFAGRPMVQVGSSRLDGMAAFGKQVLDRSAALVLLVLCSPVMLAAALAVKLSSPGPIIFRQRRLGLNKRPFDMYKFRTMVVDAERRLASLEHLNEVKGAAFKMANDPRVTPVGRILRKFSIDELPQLYNVLRNDMSLVGPRPLPTRDYERLSEDWHRRRLSVRPGLSCLWQVSGRHRLTFDRWMELDMAYIDQWSFWLDFKILAKTIVVVLRGEEQMGTDQKIPAGKHHG